MLNFYTKLKDKYWWNYIFLFLIIILYFFISIFDFNYAKESLLYFLNIFIKQIIPLLFIVYIFIFIFNIIIKNDYIKNKIEKSSSFTKYIVVILLGIISTWPVYMWYPMLKKLHEHWIKYEHIATFIYARAIKIPFLAAMFFYFWIKYTIIFNLTILLLSILVWLIINLLSNFINYENNNS